MKFTDPRKESSRQPFPAWAGPAERLRFLLGFAIRAPSPLNTQPWLFEIEGPELRVFVDVRRALKSTDPAGREMTIACGAAVENLVVAARHFGYQPEVVPGGGPHRGQPVARVWLGERLAPGPGDEELFAAIERRRTANAFYAEQLPDEILASLTRQVGTDAVAGGAGCALRIVPKWLARPVAELVADGETALWSSARHRAEVASWTRSKSRPRSLDGVAPNRAGSSAPAGLLRRLFGLGARRQRELDRRCAQQTSTTLLLSTAGDRPEDWFEAGRALERLLLAAAAEGIVACPLNSAIEVPALRRQLCATLGEARWPQWLLRVGYGPAPAVTPRRPVALVLRSFTAEVAADERAAAEGEKAAG